MNQEVCGVLVGNLCWDDGAYLMIDARIEGKFADHQAGSVTFTSETWDYIHQELSEKFSDKKIVGWYHTHPGFGIFLSNMDFFIHENFFGIKWQPAYVYDPQAETEGFFFWKETNLEQGKISIVPDVSPITVKPVERPKEKISVVITEDEEKENSKQRLTYAFITLLFLILGLSSGITIFFLYKHNKQLESEIHQGESQRIEWQQQFRLDHQRQRESDLHNRNELSQEYRRQVEQLRAQINDQNEIIRQLRSVLENLEKSQNQDRRTVKELTRQLEEAQKKARELGKQLEALRRQNTSGEKTGLPEKKTPAQVTATQTQSTSVQPPVAQDEKKPQVSPPADKTEERSFWQWFWPGNWF